MSGAQRVEGVRGRAATVLRGGCSGTAFDVDLYVKELASHGYQLHKSLHVGVSSQIYRAFRTQQQTLDVTSFSQLMTEHEGRNMPVKCALDFHSQSFTQTVLGRLRYRHLQIKYIRFILLLFHFMHGVTCSRMGFKHCDGKANTFWLKSLLQVSAGLLWHRDSHGYGYGMGM